MFMPKSVVYEENSNMCFGYKIVKIIVLTKNIIQCVKQKVSISRMTKDLFLKSDPSL